MLHDNLIPSHDFLKPIGINGRYAKKSKAGNCLRPWAHMLKVHDALWVNNGFTSCVAFDHKAHRHGRVWMDGWVRVLRPFNSISVISRRWKGEHERLCAMKRRLGSGRISPPAGFEPATSWSEVGSANRSATRTLRHHGGEPTSYHVILMIGSTCYFWKSCAIRVRLCLIFPLILVGFAWNLKQIPRKNYSNMPI